MTKMFQRHVSSVAVERTHQKVPQEVQDASHAHQVHTTTMRRKIPVEAQQPLAPSVLRAGGRIQRETQHVQRALQVNISREQSRHHALRAKLADTSLILGTSVRLNVSNAKRADMHLPPGTQWLPHAYAVQLGDIQLNKAERHRTTATNVHSAYINQTQDPRNAKTVLPAGTQPLTLAT